MENRSQYSRLGLCAALKTISATASGCITGGDGGAAVSPCASAPSRIAVCLRREVPPLSNFHLARAGTDSSLQGISPAAYGVFGAAVGRLQGNSP